MSQSGDYIRLLEHHSELYQQDPPMYWMVEEPSRRHYCFYMGNMTQTAHPYPDPINQLARVMLILVSVNRPLPEDL